MGIVPKMAQIDNPIVGFLEEDARRLHHPHDDAIVVSLRVGDYNMHRVLVDNGSSAMHDDAIVVSLRVGFKGMRVFPIGAVTLSLTVGDYP